MRPYSFSLDIDKFKKDFATLYRVSKKEEIENNLESIATIINESEGSIPSFLRKVDSIEDKKIQRYCRHAAIAQMYNADLNYQGRTYVETSTYGDVIMIQLPITGNLFIPRFSTVILSKYGDILFNEGEICTSAGLNYGKGFFIQEIIDGQVPGKYGFIDNTGARVLPCIFDSIEGDTGKAHAYFNFLHFDLRIHGNINSIGRDKLQKAIGEYDWYAFNCISEDSILFSLYSYEIEMPDELMEDLRTALSTILISKEKLQEILESK